MTMYRELTPPTPGVDHVCVLRLSDLTTVPFDPDNTSYQAYLRWLEEGNTPLPADEPPTE